MPALGLRRLVRCLCIGLAGIYSPCEPFFVAAMDAANMEHSGA